MTEIPTLENEVPHMPKSSIEHILCNVDGTDESCRAAVVAGCLARDLNARLTYVAVARHSKMTPELQEYYKREDLPEMPIPLLGSDAEACLATASGIATQCNAPDARRIVRVGDTLKELAATIDRERIDLVVLGHRKQSSAGRLVSKPLHLAIADRTDVKVLLVP